MRSDRGEGQRLSGWGGGTGMGVKFLHVQNEGGF